MDDGTANNVGVESFQTIHGTAHIPYHFLSFGQSFACGLFVFFTPNPQILHLKWSKYDCHSISLFELQPVKRCIWENTIIFKKCDFIFRDGMSALQEAPFVLSVESLFQSGPYHLLLLQLLILKTGLKICCPIIQGQFASGSNVQVE